ncbi:hypothetical protein QYM36_007102 [Artemia franciscana]|uniref:N-terminal methionine N(alpha)-acetyltransferase NatE n=1 Tax=Artemia franciscana TaxID=6661 RepID=A0AA88HVZ3_ARTSF|nr:hypothetical protein QYM36_007102 [Artemia franciscana]
MTIAKVELGDITHHNIRQLKRINQMIFPVAYNDKFYKDVVDAGELAKLAYYNDVVVGAVCCRIDTSENQRRLYIMTLGCLAPYRKTGVGTAMLNHVMSIVEKDGNFDAIYLYSKPWQLICPGVCASGILLLISGLNAATYYGGLRAFCQSITTGLKAQRCSDIRNYIVDAKPKMNVFYFQAFLVEITVFGSFVAWLFTFCSLLLRCCFLPDFETTSISATSLIAQSRPSTAMTRYSISLASGDRTRKNSSTRSRQQSSEIARAELDTTGSFSTDFEGTETAKLASPELSISTSNANGDYEDGIPMQILKNLQN